ncbi:MAG TPA: hypothetical protein VHK88_15860 [Aquihabitans sp.]|jgi:hypothetical protein|nr:hypothetical protein [Aquihabitans sp.]
MADEQDKAEALDDDELDGEYPPDHLLGAQAYGAAGTEPGAPESVAQRVGREEPEEVPAERPLTISDLDQVHTDDGDIFVGDMTQRDVVQEREAPVPAEEAAMHIIDEDTDGLDVDVHDPSPVLAIEVEDDPGT